MTDKPKCRHCGGYLMKRWESLTHYIYRCLMCGRTHGQVTKDA